MRTEEQAIRSTEIYRLAADRYHDVARNSKYPTYEEKQLAEAMGRHGGPFHEARITIRGDAFGCDRQEDYEGTLTTYMTWPEMRDLLDMPGNGYRVQFSRKTLKNGAIPSKREKTVYFHTLDMEAIVAQGSELKGSAKSWERVRLLADVDGLETVRTVAEHMLKHADYSWLARTVRNNEWLHDKIKGYLFDEVEA